MIVMKMRKARRYLQKASKAKSPQKFEKWEKRVCSQKEAMEANEILLKMQRSISLWIEKPCISEFKTQYSPLFKHTKLLRQENPREAKVRVLNLRKKGLLSPLAVHRFEATVSKVHLKWSDAPKRLIDLSPFGLECQGLLVSKQSQLCLPLRSTQVSPSCKRKATGEDEKSIDKFYFLEEGKKLPHWRRMLMLSTSYEGYETQSCF